jgi:hypothetical protein
MRSVLVFVAFLALLGIPGLVAEWIDAPLWLAAWMGLFWGYEVTVPLASKMFEWGKR